MKKSLVSNLLSFAMISSTWYFKALKFESKTFGKLIVEMQKLQHQRRMLTDICIDIDSASAWDEKMYCIKLHISLHQLKKIILNMIQKK